MIDTARKESNMQKDELKGTIVPLITPFAADESFDPQAMKQLIGFLIEQGAGALMPTALTGEGPLLEVEEIYCVWDLVFEESAGRMPVIPAVIATTTQKACRLVRGAEERGAAAVMAAPILPELYAGRSHDDVFAFYADVAMAASLPVILFNYPSLTGVDLVPSLVARLVEIDNVKYIKESSGDTKRIHAIQRTVGNRLPVICGAPDVALESLALGCRAWITGIMNVVPKSARQLIGAVSEKEDLYLARRIYYRQILPLVDLMIRNNNPTGAIKAGLCAQGINAGIPRRPGSGIAPGEKDHLKRLISDIKRWEDEPDDELAIR